MELIMASPTPPTTFVSQAFRGQRLAKRSLKNEASGLLCGSQNGAKMAPGGLWGPLGRQVGSRSLPGRLAKRFQSALGPEKNSLPSPGGPPEKFPSEISRPRGAPGAFWESPGEAPGAHLAPKRAPEASRSHFGTIFGAKMESRGFIFQAFLDTLGLYFGHLRPLLSQASRLCCCWVFAWGRFPSFSFRPVLSARGQSRAKNGAPRPNFQHFGNYSGGRHFNSFGPAECAKRLNNVNKVEEARRSGEKRK